MLEKLEIIRAHVENMPTQYKSTVIHEFTRKPAGERQKALQKAIHNLTTAFATFPPILTFQSASGPFTADVTGTDRLMVFSRLEAERIKASFAYLHDFQKAREEGYPSYQRFPFSVAFTQLCEIKARSCSGRTILREHYEKFTVHHAWRPQR